MKVDSTRSGPPVSTARPIKRGAGSERFKIPALNDAQSAAETAAATPVSAPGALLALQEVNDVDAVQSRDHPNRQAFHHGQDLLDELERLQRGLLSGNMPLEQLRRLQQGLQRNRPIVTDPNLSAILDDVELRVAVEIAKFDSLGT